MELYFSPLACSLATRIALYEAGAPATFTEVDAKTKRTSSQHDFRQIYPLGLVPTLRTDDGGLLSENAAVLQYIAEQYPAANLAPRDGIGRAKLQQWLCFIGTELHKGLFNPLLDATAPDEVKTYALATGIARLDFLQEQLRGREFLLDRFSVADAYLVTILNWTVVTPLDLTRWPGIAAYAARLRERPSVARAIAEERSLYAAQQARHRAA